MVEKYGIEVQLREESSPTPTPQIEGEVKLKYDKNKIIKNLR